MLPLKKYERKRKSILLLQVYAKYKREFFNPDGNKQEVWRKIAREMREKGSFNYDELQWYRKVKELRREYEKNKYIPATSGEMVDFKIAAKNAFQTIENPVPSVNYPAPEIPSISPFKKYEKKMESILLLQVYEKYKRVLVTPGVNKEVVWRRIACEMKEKGSYNYDESHWCHKIEELRQDYERIKYIPATSGEMIDFKIAAKNAFQTTENSVTAAPNKVKMATWTQKHMKNYKLFRRNIALLTVYRLHKDEFSIHANAESVWEKIADKMNDKFPKCTYTPENCHSKLLFMKKQYEKDKNSEEVTSTKDATFFKVAKLAFETKKNPVSFMDFEKRQKQIASLKAFTMYKAQFLSPHANQQELWQKITETANKLSLRNKPYSVANFLNHLRSLKSNYDKLKNSKTAIATPENAIFFKEAKLAFESTGSEAMSIDQILYDGLSEKMKEKFERDLALLRAYNIYKAEFSSPDENDESVWEKIAGTVRISCSLDYWTINDCRLELFYMKEKYEKKKQDWCLAPEADYLFEEEKLAFETVGYSEEQMDLLTEIKTESV